MVESLNMWINFFYKKIRQHRLPAYTSRGVSLIEVLIAIGIFVLMISTIGLLGMSGPTLAREGAERTQAAALANEGIEAAHALRSDNFSNLVSGTHGIALSAGRWIFSGTSDVTDQFTRSVTVASVGSGRTRVSSDVSWEIAPGRSGLVHFVTYLHNLYSLFWLQTTTADFSSGKHNGTQVAAVGDGAVSLGLDGDWSNANIVASRDTGNPQNVNALIERGGVLYAGSNVGVGAEFTAIDIANTSAGLLPQIGQMEISANVNGIAVAGDYAYLATGDNARELIVVRLSDMQIVNSLNLAGTTDALSVAASGTMLYLGRGSAASFELYSIDIATPEIALPVLGSVAIAGDVNTILPYGSYLFLGTTDATTPLLVVDGGTLTTVNSLTLPGGVAITGLNVLGNMLYATRLVSTAPEFIRIDVTDPLAALTVDVGVDLASSVYGISVGANGFGYLATADPTGELTTVQLSTMTLSSAYDVTTGSGARAVYFGGGHAFVGMNASVPEVVAIGGGMGAWSAATGAGVVNTAGTIDGKSVAISGNYAYMGTLVNGGGGEFYIIDITNKNAPVTVGTFEVNASVNAVAVNGNYAYLATSNTSRELQIINITNKAAPTLAGFYNASGNLQGLSVGVLGTQIYLGTQNNTSGSGREFYVINAAIPASPVLLGTREITGDVNGIALGGGYVFVATSNNSKEFSVLDVSAPASIQEKAVYNTTGTTDALAVAYDAGNNIIYLTTGVNGGSADFYAFSLGVSGTVALQNSLVLGASNYGVSGANNLAFVANNTAAGGVTVIDMTTPTSPQILSTVNLGGTGQEVVTDGSYAYLATTANTQEFVIVGPGAIPTTLIIDGWFTSSSFDSTNVTATWGAMTWTMSGTGSTVLQTRTASTPAGLSSALWVGPSGTENTYYTTSGTTIGISPQATGSEWIQFRARLTGDSVTSPFLEDVQISYN